MRSREFDHVGRASAAREGNDEGGFAFEEHLEVAAVAGGLAVEVPLCGEGEGWDGSRSCPLCSEGVGATCSSMDEGFDGWDDRLES